MRPASQAHHLVTFGLDEIPRLKEISLRAIEEDTQWCKPVSPVCREMNTNGYVTGKKASKGVREAKGGRLVWPHCFASFLTPLFLGCHGTGHHGRVSGGAEKCTAW